MKKTKVFILTLLIFLSGCAPTTEIDKLMIVSGISVDYMDGIFDVTTQIINMKNSDQTELSPINLKTNGNSIVESISKLHSIEGQKLYYTHAQLILVNAEYFRTEGSSHLIDLLNFEPRFRSSIKIAVTEGNASDVINTKPKTDPIPCFSIADSISESSKMLLAANIPYYLFFNETLEEGVDGILPIVNTLTEDNDEKLPIIDGTALFKDTVMVSTLTPKQTIYLMMVRDPQQKSIFSTSDYSFLIEKANSKLSYKDKQFYIILEMDLSLLEGDQADNKYLTEIVAEDCKKGINEVISICKECGSDPIGIGRHIKRYYTNVWENIYPQNWIDFYKNLTVNIEVKASIIPSYKLSGDKKQ